MCNCRSMVRIPDIETQNGKYPMPEHAPNCEDYKLEAFAKVTYDGISCIMEINEASRMVFESEELYELTNVYLTRDQFENMEEFSGF